MKILVVGLVNYAALEESLAIPIRATKHNVHPQRRLLRVVRQPATGNTGQALGLKQKQTSSPNTVLAAPGAARPRLLPLSVEAVV